MRTWDGQEIPELRSTILGAGDLVKIGSVLNNSSKDGKIGIIIQCSYGFGLGLYNEWFVLIDGLIQRVDESQLWPVEIN